MADHHAGLLPKAGQRQQQPGILFALARAIKRKHVPGPVRQQLPEIRAARIARDFDGFPGPGAGRFHGHRPRWTDLSVRAGDEDAEGAVDDVGELPGRDNSVHEPLVEEVLRHLDVLRKGRTVQRLVHAGPQESEEGAGFGYGDVPEGAPGGHDAACSGVAQVDEVGQTGLPVGPNCGADLDHGEEGDGAFLHSGAA